MEEKKIIFVDKENIFLEAIARYLEAGLEMGNQIFSFSNPQLALMKIKSLGKSPDLVVTDLEMPGMNGVQLARKIRGIFDEAKIIIMTKNTNSKLLTGIGDLVYKVISKQMSSDDLLGEIEKALS
jgi:DNA-binding NarL/FixJ family response regulator